MVSDVQHAMFRERVATHDTVVPGYADAWSRLAGVILQHGGDAVVPPWDPDPDIDRFLQGMTVWSGSGAVLWEMRANACHANARELYSEGAVDMIGTGYALSEDGLWRCHSWGFLTSEEPVPVVVETTVPRVSYVGVMVGGE